ACGSRSGAGLVLARPGAGRRTCRSPSLGVGVGVSATAGARFRTGRRAVPTVVGVARASVAGGGGVGDVGCGGGGGRRRSYLVGAQRGCSGGRVGGWSRVLVGRGGGSSVLTYRRRS